jgi:uroporphyrin-III C-methyltransferase/precorrin-2 dehydrogenase/sirohydrochlorin ferrochelatase
MKSFPLFLSLEHRPVVLVGGTHAAVAKARLLLAAGARLTVIAERPAPAFYDWAYEGTLTLRRRGFEPADLDGAVLAVVASASDDKDRAVADAARARNVPVNVIDRPELSDFTVPAIVDRGQVVAAVSTSGAAPSLAQRLRRDLEARLSPALDGLAELARSLRPLVEAALPDAAARRVYWANFFDGPISDRYLAGDEATARQLACDALTQAPASGHVALVGAGPGDPELLTLKALRLLQRADVVVHDRLVGRAVLDYARRDAERIDVGKRRGHHAYPQAAINALLLRLAGEGKRVVRLKGGDPFVFGRGGEELAVLVEHGVPVELVPGITAATGCAAVAGFPLTHRDHASAVTFVSGEAKGGGLALDWAALAKSDHTLVVYMGLGTARTIAEQLVAHGMAADMPVAVVENGTLPAQRTLFGRLDDLGELVRAHAVHPPALLVIGRVAGLAAGRVRTAAAA